MGSSFSHLIPCLNPNNHNHNHNPNPPPPTTTSSILTLDETLGHSFRYVRSSSRFLSPTPSSDHFPSFHLDDHNHPRSTAFRSISGASVSANTSTPLTFSDTNPNPNPNPNSNLLNGGFDCTPSFFALPLQPLPRGGGGGTDSAGFFLSGPIDRNTLSGPLDSSSSDTCRLPFSAPLNNTYNNRKKRRKNSLAGGIKRTFHRSFSEKKRPWVVPVVGKKDVGVGDGEMTSTTMTSEVVDGDESSNVQWALGKAGEDRVHVVVSEEHGWLFVGIYDGFNGPDAPEFLMAHLYRAVFTELKGLFWDNEEDVVVQENENEKLDVNVNVDESEIVVVDRGVEDRGNVKRVTFQSEHKEIRKKLWQFLAEDEAEDGLDLSGSDRFAFSVDDAVSVSNSAAARSAVSRRSLLLSKLKHGLSRSKEGGGHNRSFFRWGFGVEDKDKVDNGVNRIEESSCRNGRRRKMGPVDHELVLRALSLALEKTEQAYLELTDKVIDQYPELALMGSCLLAVLMRDEDVYVMNVGDSRAIVAQFEPLESCSHVESKAMDCECSAEDIVEESTASGVVDEVPVTAMKLAALQLSTDHCTSIEQEVLRIKSEHPDDSQCIVNDRVKGRLKVTRAFGAGFLKQPKFNDALLEMFRNEFIGNAPYISCIPSLWHHKLGPRDQFLVLSSDGLYQYLTNQEVVSFVENFMEKFPDGDPAQHLIEELLNRAAKKAGMDFHDLLDIPQGDRRKYHDDVTVMVISLEGRIWKSSGKYP